MEAMISSGLIGRIAVDIASNPLKPGEFRLIKGLGGLYVSRESKRGEQGWMFQVEINGENFYIFGFME